jgi:hypothetical protein
MSGAALQDYHAREYLLSVLNEHDISLGSDDVSWAFASAKTREEIINWVKEYLQEHTLLSKDEATLFVISRYPGVAKFADLIFSSQNISSCETSGSWTASEKHGILLHDHHFKSAIDSLRQSTTLIEKHTKVLEEQRIALQEIGYEMQGNPSSPLSSAHARINGHEYNNLNMTVS